MKMTTIHTRPKDIEKFLSPQEAAEQLTKLVEALKNGDPNKKVYLRLNIRIWNGE